MTPPRSEVTESFGPRPAGQRIAGLSAVSLSVGIAVLAGCALMPETEGPARKENIYGVTESNRLINFNAGQPARILSNRALTGLAAGERLLGIDYRVARGQLFGLGSTGQLYQINTGTAAATRVGTGIQQPGLASGDIGFDFNPTVDRIRLISDGRTNARIHPDTGMLVDSDPNAAGLQLDGPLAYAPGDVNAGKTPRVQGAAYTYNKVDEKITTNFAIDAEAGVLVTQGAREGTQPPVSPNTGRLFTVGKLGIAAIGKVAFDIADLNNAAFAAITPPGSIRSRWYTLSLETGAATSLGTIGVPDAVVGVAVEP